MTSIDDFYRKDCGKIDASFISAYIDLMYDPENATGIILDHSWGTDKLDLLPLIKAGETVTSLELLEDRLRFNREDGEADCIYGDDLSRIISLQLLKDVSQEAKPSEGDIYIFDGELFQPFDFNTWKGNTDLSISNAKARINVLENKVANLEQQVANHEARLQKIEAMLTPPEGAPDNVKVAFGNINNYGDVNNSGDKSKGIYTHSLNSNVTGDQRFA